MFYKLLLPYLEILVNERSCQRLVFVIHSTPDQIEKVTIEGPGGPTATVSKFAKLH